VTPVPRLAAGLLALMVLSAQASPTYYRVVGVKRPDRLNIRERPDPDSDLIGQIPADARRVRGFGCTDDTASRTRWCRVKYGAVVGWVRGTFVEEQ
jgi:uncharacterized protein YraI